MSSICGFFSLLTFVFGPHLLCPLGTMLGDGGEGIQHTRHGSHHFATSQYLHLHHPVKFLWCVCTYLCNSFNIMQMK